MFSVPEIDHLSAVGARSGATLLPMLRKAWSGEALNSQYVDPAKRLRVDRHSYRLTLTAGVQPRRAGVLLDDADGGTPQRFVWLPTDDPLAPDTAPDEPAPLTVLIPPPPAPGHQAAVAVSPAVALTVKSARQRQLRGEQGDGLDGHRLYAQLKAAGALAVLDGHLATEGVTDDDWRLAGLVLEASDAVRADVVREQRLAASETNRARGAAEAERAEVIEDSAVKRAVTATLRVVERLPPDGWLNGSDLRRAVGVKHRQHLADALGRLADAGLVVVEDVEYRGQPGQRVGRAS